ncbi:hypothetical protein B1748_23565 [Paenibacillus sp. MY03]|nr:hypothetical protein B1748_23565 [Paenibacillus sp. MY03]
MTIPVSKTLSDDEVRLLLQDEIKWDFIGNESEFESHILEHIDDLLDGMSLPPKRVVLRQKQFRFDNTQIIIDLLVQHTDRSITIFEVKKKSDRNPHTSPSLQVGAIGQLMLYKTIVGGIYDPNVRLVLIDNKIHFRTYLTIKTNNLPIALVEFQKDFVLVSHIPDQWR